ncbi:hypothetical protein NEMBOFW57_002950 [Staphylotrichum longicolle]|uniref:Nephrocystin 3-like N-terminal domain-containing protein n=1 Tax=Staphylotrichum longicolle TaxID=669026 RepID=A0AAD4I448_9PEZI|nr:hypothetical protein NEMBOFW57_002950 [Staphylotrichum longicolle]
MEDRSYEISSAVTGTPLGLFRSLLHQILRQTPDALHDLVERFTVRRLENGNPGENWNWHEGELRCFLESCLPKVARTRPVWLFIDALDECGKDNAVSLVETFKTLLRSLASPSGDSKQFHICFSCRHYPIVDVDESLFEVCTEHENATDISTFVNGQLAAFRTRTSSTIPALITESASGVFMWARLVVKKVLDLEREGAGLKTMEAAIRSTPPDLNKLYQQLIRDMGVASLKLVQWICFAVRPLSIDELRWAMLIEPDCPYQSLQACKSAEDYVDDNAQMKRRVQTLSCGLAEVTRTHVVQFIHQSVMDFFVEIGLSTLNGGETQSEAAIRAHFRKNTNLVHVASRYGLLGLLTAMLQMVDEGTLHINAKDNAGWTPLWWAAVKRQDAVVKLLLRTGIVDADAKDEDGQTLVFWAAKNGRSALLSMLLDTGRFDADAKDKNGRTSLWWPVFDGNTAIVEMLLGRCTIDVNAKDSHGRTPLWYAVCDRNRGIVKLLLDTGKAEVNPEDSACRTPLWLAADMELKAVVKLLLDTGVANVDAKDEDGRTPLSCAAGRGNLDIIKLLLTDYEAVVRLLRSAKM